MAFAQEAAVITEITRPTIRILNSQDFSLEKEFYPFVSDSKVEGANIATADLDSDGFKEIIVGAGRNEKPLVRIFNNQGEFQSEFLAYGENFRKGLKIAVADLFNDGSQEIITAPNEGGGPQIRIFDKDGKVIFSFFAFSEDLRGGANVSVGDVNGDGQPEILVGSGYNSEPIIKIFDNYTNFIKGFYAFEDSFLGGVNVLAADLDNDNQAEIIAAPALDKEPRVKIFDYDGNLINQFLAYASGFGGGVNLAASDVDRDGYLDILTGAGYSGGAHLRIFDAQGNPKINPKLFVYDNFKGGISVADGDIDNDGITEILAATQTISTPDRYGSYKIIEVDLTKQTLYAVLKGAPIKEFLISSGRYKYPTPEGHFKIYAKALTTRMTGFYGPDNPENYDLKDVPHVMAFYKDYAIHGAYWHWNFGTRVSHGCINMKLPDAEWLYNWAAYGTPVNIYSSI